MIDGCSVTDLDGQYGCQGERKRVEEMIDRDIGGR